MWRGSLCLSDLGEGFVWMGFGGDGRRWWGFKGVLVGIAVGGR